MGIGAVTSLRDVRVNLLGFSENSAAYLSGIRVERLRELEKFSGPPMSVWEADALGRLYGLDEETIASVPFRIPRGDALNVLASSDEFHQVGDRVRAHVVGTARAARDIVRLREILQLSRPSVPRLSEINGEVPWKDGKAIAMAARSRIGPDDANPILSMRDWVRDFLPGVPVLYAKLGDSGPAALTFAGEKFGPALVVNLDGKNTNPCARRFSLAHEIYHLLVDWNQKEPIATLSGYLEEVGFEREQRANSFAIRFLCPEVTVGRLSPDDAEAAKALIIKWGLHYRAARLYLHNIRGATLPAVAPQAVQANGNEADWIRAEEPDGIEGFPIKRVLPERRTIVAQLASEAYSKGLIPRDEFAEFLDVTPGENLESVLALFDLDPPADTVAA